MRNPGRRETERTRLFKNTHVANKNQTNTETSEQKEIPVIFQIHAVWSGAVWKQEKGEWLTDRFEGKWNLQQFWVSAGFFMFPAALWGKCCPIARFFKPHRTREHNSFQLTVCALFPTWKQFKRGIWIYSLHLGYSWHHATLLKIKVLHWCRRNAKNLNIV